MNAKEANALMISRNRNKDMCSGPAKKHLGKDIYLPHPDMFYVIDGKQDFSKQPLKRMDKLYLLGITNTDVSVLKGFVKQP
jgi:hypothetical protein